MSSPSKGARRAAKLGALCLAGMLAAAGIAERAFRARAQWPGLFPARRPRPYVMYDNGLVSEQVRPGDRLRIFLLGGSTVAVGPLAHELEAEIRRRGVPEARVLNAGIISGCSGQSLARIVHEIAGLEPDLIVEYDGGNDVLAASLSPRPDVDKRPGYPFNFVVYENNPLQKPPEDYPWLALNLFESAILRYFFHDRFVEAFTGLSGSNARAGVGTDAWRERIADTYLENLRRAGVAARAFGADYAAFFQPLACFTDPVEPRRANPSVETVRRMLRERLASGRTRGVATDLSDFLDGRGAAPFTDGIHMTDEYYGVMARALCDRVMPLVRRRAARERA